MKPAGTNSTLITVVLTYTVVLFIFILTAITVLICIIFKKKSKRKIEITEHVYDSVPVTQHTVTSLSEPIKLDSDEDMTISDSTASQYELADNEIYSTINPPPTPAAETALNTESTAADL